MCGRYTALTEDEIIEIREILKSISLRIVRDDFEDFGEKTGSYGDGAGEVFPSDIAPVITGSADGVAFENAKRGFRKWDGTGVIINARSESLRTKKTFSALLDTGRCVVPAGEFFEWERLKSGNKKYYARDKNGNLLFLAGLYRDIEDSTSPDGFTREFVIITRKSTGVIADIHDRMPVILRADQIEPYFTGELTPEDLAAVEYELTVLPCDGEEQTSFL